MNEQYRGMMFRADGAAETTVEMLERKLYDARRFHADMCRELHDHGACDMQMLEHFAREIDDLRTALGALYVKGTQ